MSAGGAKERNKQIKNPKYEY